MLTGEYLDQERRSLIEKYYSALRLQMQKLSSHFPTQEELIALSDVTGALSNESVDEDEQMVADRELLYDLSFSFRTIEINNQKQVVWKFQDTILANPEYLVTKDGELLQGNYIDPADARRAKVKPGWTFYPLRNSDRILTLGCEALLANDTAIENIVSRWDKARELSKKYVAELFPEVKYFATS